MSNLSYNAALLKDAIEAYTGSNNWYYFKLHDFRAWLKDSPFKELDTVQMIWDFLDELDNKGIIKLERSKGNYYITYTHGQILGEAKGIIGYQKFISENVKESDDEYDPKYLIAGTILDSLHEREERGLVEPISPASLLEWGRNPRNWGWDDLKEEGIKPTLNVIKQGLRTLLDEGLVVELDGKFSPASPSFLQSAQSYVLDKAKDLPPGQRKDWIEQFIAIDPDLIDKPPFRRLGYPKPGILLEDKQVKNAAWKDFKEYPSIDPEIGIIDVNTLKEES